MLPSASSPGTGSRRMSIYPLALTLEPRISSPLGARRFHQPCDLLSAMRCLFSISAPELFPTRPRPRQPLGNEYVADVAAGQQDRRKIALACSVQPAGAGTVGKDYLSRSAADVVVRLRGVIAGEAQVSSA